MLLGQSLLEDLEGILNLLELKKWSKSQEDFKSLIQKLKFCPSSELEAFGSISHLMENFFKMAQDHANLILNQSYICSNKKCPIMKEHSGIPRRSLQVFDFPIIDYKDASDSILENFLLQDIL